LDNGVPSDQPLRNVTSSTSCRCVSPKLSSPALSKLAPPPLSRQLQASSDRVHNSGILAFTVMSSTSSTRVVLPKSPRQGLFPDFTGRWKQRRHPQWGSKVRRHGSPPSRRHPDTPRVAFFSSLCNIFLPCCIPCLLTVWRHGGDAQQPRPRFHNSPCDMTLRTDSEGDFS
jgi:hypothetical protein